MAEESLMLHYRLFVEVNDDRKEVEKLALEQLHSWLRRKGLDADALGFGEEVALAEHANGALEKSERADGSRSFRATITEAGSVGTWRTQLTVDVPGNQRAKPWLWLDLEGPSHIDAAIPHLARSLLEVLDATTDDVRHGQARPVQVTSEVADLVDAVCDPRRRSLVFVAGSDPSLPFGRWLEHVRDLLKDCVGLAGGYVLSPEATTEFNNAIGPAHRIDPWTVRTFRPGVEPDDAEDGRRHKVLGMDRIVADPVRRLARMLGRRAREAALDTPLPAAATKIDRVFAQIINANLVATLDQPTAPTLQQDPLAVAEPYSDPVAVALGLILGPEVTAERVMELGVLAEVARSAQAARTAIEARLAEYDSELAALRADHLEVRRRLEDTQFDAADAEEAQAAAAGEVRRLQRLLISAGRADEVWDATANVPERRPQDYEQLVDMLSQWERVSFTGDADRLRELDQYDTGSWAGKIWDVFGVLDDYARVVSQGEFEGSVHQYLGSPPTGCRASSPNRHAADESPTVRSNAKLRAERMFPVPVQLSADKEIFMGAHFKIAQFGIISPRLYYCNDARGTGRVYVGYIGKHLKNSQTN